MFLTINHFILVIHMYFIYDIFMNIQTAIWPISYYVMLVFNDVLFNNLNQLRFNGCSLENKMANIFGPLR